MKIVTKLMYYCLFALIFLNINSCIVSKGDNAIIGKNNYVFPNNSKHYEYNTVIKYINYYEIEVKNIESERVEIEKQEEKLKKDYIDLKIKTEDFKKEIKKVEDKKKTNSERLKKAKDGLMEWESLRNEGSFYNDDVYYVNNFESFVNSIGSNRDIIFTSNEILIPPQRIQKQYREEYYWVTESFTIKDITNMRLIGNDDNNYVHIYSTELELPTIKFENCKSITLKKLRMGHNPPGDGFCSHDGVVLYYNKSDYMNVDSCSLYGCGTFGLKIVNSKYCKTKNTQIYDCTFGIVKIEESEDIEFRNNKMYGNTSIFPLFNFSESDNILFKNCEIYNNRNQESNTFVCVKDSKSIIYDKCSIKNNNIEKFICKQNDDDELFFNDCVFSNNTFKR